MNESSSTDDSLVLDNPQLMSTVIGVEFDVTKSTSIGDYSPSQLPVEDGHIYSAHSHPISSSPLVREGSLNPPPAITMQIVNEVLNDTRFNRVIFIIGTFIKRFPVLDNNNFNVKLDEAFNMYKDNFNSLN